MIPERLRHLDQHPGGPAWLAALPAAIESARTRWALELGDPYPDSYVSVVMPATTPDGAPVVLKVQFPHPESTHEAAALRHWGGDAAIRLLDEDPEHHALLLERCHPGTHLADRGADEALDAFVELLPRLWKPAGAPFTTLADEADGWAASLPRQWERAGQPYEVELIDAAIEQLQALARSQAEHDQVLLHQDLHGQNVLAAEREPWLAIDPKPLVGERAFSVAPIVRDYDLGHGRDHVEHRLTRLVDELDLDRDRALGWALGQTVAWSFEGEGALGRHVETARWLLEIG